MVISEQIRVMRFMMYFSFLEWAPIIEFYVGVSISEINLPRALALFRNIYWSY